MLFGPWRLWKTRFEQFRVEEDVSRVLDWMLQRLEFVTLTQASLSTGKCILGDIGTPAADSVVEERPYE
jgi:hypothetical protein